MKPHMISPWWRHPWFLFIAAIVYLLVVPVIYFVRVRRLSNQKAELERIVAARTAELAQANSQLAELSRMDSLTGLANRRCLDDALDKEWRRAKRQKVSLSLLMLDVDHFKAYNDRLGHPAGDRCLKSVAVALAALHTRAGEMVARYGGEEFAVLLPTVPHAAAVAAAERVRERVSDLQIPHPASDVGPVLTISIGVATVIPSDGITSADLVDAADRALYQAKHEGRNRVRGVESVDSV